jgi:ABC-type transporter Mla MlaB component
MKILPLSTPDIERHRMENERLTGRLRLDGSLCISDVDVVRMSLLNTIQQNSVIELDFSGTTDVDVSFLQLVIAARRMTRQAGKTLRLAAPAEGALHNALLRAGLLGPGRGPDAGDDGFWTAGSDGAP